MSALKMSLMLGEKRLAWRNDSKFNAQGSENPGRFCYYGWSIPLFLEQTGLKDFIKKRLAV